MTKSKTRLIYVSLKLSASLPSSVCTTLKSQLTPFSSRQLSPQKILHHSTTLVRDFTYKVAKNSEMGESKTEQAKSSCCVRVKRIKKRRKAQI